MTPGSERFVSRHRQAIVHDNLTKNYEGQSVEPGSNVGERPQYEAELDRINDIFDQE